jgi:uncharacterized protein YjcR
MKFTSAEANKLLKKLHEEKEMLNAEENKTSVFVAATVENVEDVRPAYSLDEMNEKINAVDQKIIKVKHAINMFNTKTKVDGFDMTIDEMLVFIPQLTAKKEKLRKMSERLPMQRKAAVYGNKSNFIEYEYTNYNTEVALEMFKKVSDTLSEAQFALDKVNTTRTMEIDI